MASLVEIMDGVSGQLKATLEANRVAFEHRLTKGEAIEESVRAFFRRHLPDSIGVAHGQVIDRHGSISKQLDVILYDAAKTPVLFSDEAGGNRVIPVEGVIAAVEVKTALSSGDIAPLAESAQVLKSLESSAFYVPEGSIITNVTNAYGREWTALPPMYFVMAFEGPNLTTVRDKMQAAHIARPLHQRIDMACILNKGVVANSLSGSGGLEALPSPSSSIRAVETERSLLLFYLLMTRYVLQAGRPAIAIQNYLPRDFAF
ncbi:DUF6602 domain-containing protein [Brevibacterium linens]|uniref:DUF6602 domain-containing protein n=1 Tax=Brevibacterium linens TaxID=1703 RepID=A0A2H1KIS0_BRELN|nr:DUF6602 domain-containing protein [Brevibacterium linens]SMX99680.1 hypothetical protein BLIN101_03395 [Brevibacterium linens]